MAKSAPIPKNEEERLAELARYQILDTIPERAFDDLVRILSTICETPIGVVSLVDADRQWFKSTQGLGEVRETSRDIAFCAHTILDTRPMIIPDAKEDERFADNPLVTEGPRVRFYAGAPLVTANGHAVGALCAIDQVPRQLTEEQTLALEALARQVVDQFELRFHIRKLEEQSVELERNRENNLRKILEAMQSGLFVVSRTGALQRVNPALERMLGYQGAELQGAQLSQILGDEALRAELLADREANTGRETTLRAKDGHQVPVLLSQSVITDDSGAECVVCVAQDLTEIKTIQSQLLSAQKLEAIGRLAAGISHEINTPIQFIGDNTRFLLDSMKDLQAVGDFVSGVATGEVAGDGLVERAGTVLQETDLDFLLTEAPRAIEQTLEGVQRVSRIVRAMKEFSHPGTDQMQLVSLNKLIESTITVSTNEWKYVAVIDANLDPNLPLVPCLPADFNQVVLNLIVNAAHALEEVAHDAARERGVIRITTSVADEHAVVTIEDNGSGIPQGIIGRIFDPFFTTKEVGKGTGQGLAIARSVVVDKHKGRLEVSSTEGVGTRFTILLPLENTRRKAILTEHATGEEVRV